MNKYAVKKDTGWSPELRNTVIFGFLLRLLMLILIVYVLGDIWDIFYIEDDKKYEELAAVYRANAHSLVDMDLFDKLTIGYAKQFWPFVMCVFTRLTGVVYAGRFINIILSTCCIPIVYKLCYEVSNGDRTALTSARLFAYLPFPILVSCFPIKDIFIMLGIMYAFLIFVRVQSGKKVSILHFVLLGFFLFCIYLSRGAVSELMLLFYIVYYLQKLFREKKYVSALLFLLVAVVIFMTFRTAIFASFAEKVDDYGNYGVEEATGLNAIRVTGIADIYKLPLAYAFAMLQPMKLELFSLGSDVRPWRLVIGYSNMTMYPIAVGAWLYLFSKKHNLFYWLSSFVMFTAVIMLSLGVSRHYLFLLPAHIINYSLYMDKGYENYKNRRTIIILGTFALLVLVFCYSLVKLL